MKVRIALRATHRELSYCSVFIDCRKVPSVQIVRVVTENNQYLS